jgi:hypothetical protein
MPESSPPFSRGASSLFILGVDMDRWQHHVEEEIVEAYDVFRVLDIMHALSTMESTGLTPEDIADTLMNSIEKRHKSI